jgi:hypothetical protein
VGNPSAIPDRQLPSPSKHDRVWLCGGSDALPGVDHVGGHYQSRGRVLHAFLEDVNRLGELAAALERVPAEFREACEVIEERVLRMADPKSYAAEVAIAYDVDTGTARVLGQGLKREYSIGPREFPGTIDVVGLSDNAVLIFDYKTGYAKLGRPKTLRQLRAYAVLAARAFNRDRAVVGIIRIREDGSSYFEQDVLESFDLAEAEWELHELANKVAAERAKVAAGELPELTEGEHCDRCPAFMVCPAKMALARQFALAPERLEQLVENATPEQLAAAWVRAKAVAEVAERVIERIKAAAREQPIPLGNGAVLGAVPTEEIIPETALPIIAQLYGEKVAEASKEVTVSVTKSSIEAALRKHVLQKGMRITHLLRETWDFLRARHAMRGSSAVRKHTPKTEPKALPAPPAAEPDAPSLSAQ